MDKEVVVHIPNGILLSYKKEHTWVSSNEVAGPRSYYTEWSKSERERQILCINAYIWNLERWYQWSQVQDSKGDTDVKNRLLDSVGEGEGEMIWENCIETLCEIGNHWEFDAWSRAPKAGALWQPGGIGWGGRWWWSLGWRGPMADSCWCVAKKKNIVVIVVIIIIVVISNHISKF